MSRVINSPGVQIIETDLSQYQAIGGGTITFVPGFASQGPTDEIISITTVAELEQIYGIPETTAEKYFYHTAKEILNSPATLLTTRLPYGSGSGEGFTNQYSALLYPVASSGNTFQIGEPKHITFSAEDYVKLLQNNFKWKSIDGTLNSASYTNAEMDAGIVVINNSQTTVNEFFEGYYITLTDNANFGPTTPFDAVTTFKTLTAEDDFYSVPQNSGRLGFALSGNFTPQGQDSVSEVIETIPKFNFANAYYNDSLILNVFKVRNSIYQPQVLVYTLAETHIGSLDSSKRTIANNVGSKTFYLQNIVNTKNSSNIKLFVNPNLARTKWTGLSSVNPAKSTRVQSSARGMFAAGVFTPTYSLEGGKQNGDLQLKLERALTLVESPETVDIDIVVDAGLSTIAANVSGTDIYDDTNAYETVTLSDPTSNIVLRWKTVYDVYNNFVTNIRKDCVFIIDPLRQIFVNGPDTKTLSIKGNNFSTNIYTPLKNLLTNVDTNYGVMYGNWIKVYNNFEDKFIWIPSSGYAAAVYARSDAATQTWIAPAGLNRGKLTNLVDLAINPNQKQRDFLYTIGINPIVSFAGEGFTIFGQKTLQDKPSAFDRVNVRRLFLSLERATQKALKYFVFEPNSEFTRTRLKNTIRPVFDLAKNTEGLYEYLVVCDERNNTPDVIDRNELAVDIYIKPVKAAEFILVNFIATRTGQNFQELI